MSELPPDPARLRVILRHLEEALAENAIVHTYLDIQRNKVVDALKAAEARDAWTPQPAPEQPKERRPADRTPGESEGFKLDRMRTPDGPVASSVHLDDCKMVGPLAQALSAHEARIALVDEQLDECEFCRPGAVLGVDIGT
ncbi:hypothetical protein AQJ23_45315 [Streptomyces antibioticus]|nr:DUF6233 domain-containing protein [Streptomyces antibioticus]KUN16100.1 hypothetical protein AQJ23_45315 [Streptomyces antibioticus]